ncbi:DUF1028 domain-containing protein [Marinicella sp. S1101]|uniref:DUF1028 domain-containing protein n=1 Tax=Marinicella marina TaxID=2996016 RepID=UPI002260E74B|nr:DUF1028 domain-containing protein [Marinicella marina]MCX7552354.1 DUF1028 domain-containing protein [Marinicella marina]MDJ1139229.1 DUF1028 domain-containing protein [Marinicella marina]
MNKITQTLTLLLFLLSLSLPTMATFSIVAVDPETGELGSAGATCIGAEDGAIVISDIVLNTGVIHTQSFYSPTNQNNARVRMELGESPQQIMDWLVSNDVSNNPPSRQYIAVDLNEGSPRSAGFTGSGNFDEKIHVAGPGYAIAGNILISEAVVTDMETAFTTSQGSLAERLMAAMQAAKRVGADSRCSELGVSSASAFIRVARSCDTNSDIGQLPIDLNVWISNSNDVFEPIDELQSQFNALPEPEPCITDVIFVDGFD